MLNLLLKVYPISTLMGSLIILFGIFITAMVYRGKENEKYKITNHFISELGERPFSKNAVVFNTTMVVGGILFLPMMVGLGIRFDSIWGWLGTGAGLLAAIGCIFVGIFPMDNLTPHRVAAMTFFRAGLATAILFTVAVIFQPPDNRFFPLYLTLFGLFAVLSYASFLLSIRSKTDKHNNPNYILDPKAMPVRPHFWRTPFLEWMVFFSTILWFLVIALQQ